MIVYSLTSGFSLFAVHTISFSCLLYPYYAEAGLLDNETFTPVTPNPSNGNDSSQSGHSPNITSPILIHKGNDPPDTARPSLPNPLEEASTEDSETTKPEDGFETVLGSISDAGDTYNGGSVDVFQYPLKKFTKYSHLKYGKVRTKGKTSEEVEGEEHRVESVKIVEEKVNVNVSITDDVTTRSGPEVDKHSDSQSDGGTSGIPSTDAPDFISTTFAAGNDTSVGENVENESNATGDSVSPESRKMSSAPAEEQKDVEILKNETLVIESKVEESGTYTTEEAFLVRNRVAAATSAHNYEVEQSELNAGSITGITLGILVIFSLFGAVSFVLYRRRYLNKPEVLHDKCSNLDSSGYIDETSLRENSEEMYSLDNDSFLNSLEAMTIQNYWTENVKHTKL